MCIHQTVTLVGGQLGLGAGSEIKGERAHLHRGDPRGLQGGQRQWVLGDEEGVLWRTV